MDITPTSTTTIPNTTTKSPEEHDTETPPPPPPRIPNTINTPKVLSFSNGVLKRHHPHTHHHHPFTTTNHPIQVTYKECLKNHAATLGGHALDGCGEFMPSPTATAADPTSIKCAACGCHRNFHRREPEEPPITAVIEFQPHHRHHPPPPPPPFPTASRSPNSSSPPPISSSYYPSAPHMLLALSSGGGIAAAPESAAAAATVGRKRFRTKFTQEQKEKMLGFAEKVGWKMQKRDEIWVNEFCNEIGVDRGVLKVWMHNNKNNFVKKEIGSINGGVGGARSIVEGDINNTSIINNKENENKNNDGSEGARDHYDGGANIGVNGSSSSS